LKHFDEMKIGWSFFERSENQKNIPLTIDVSVLNLPHPKKPVTGQEDIIVHKGGVVTVQEDRKQEEPYTKRKKMGGFSRLQTNIS
jgi:hypothetical protein